MGQSYRSMLFHIVFAAKNRQPLITPELQPRLYAYIAEMITERFGELINIGGTQDHIHIFLDKKPGVNEPDMVRDIKAYSSGWIHKTFPRLQEFAWQSGYGLFSVSGTHRAVLSSYIQEQAEHHRRFSLKEEIIRLLRKNGIEYDEKYMWV